MSRQSMQRSIKIQAIGDATYLVAYPNIGACIREFHWRLITWEYSAALATEAKIKGLTLNKTSLRTRL